MKNIIFALFCISILAIKTYGQSEIRMTNENENTFKAYIDSTDTDPVEGIYKAVSGTFYRLAIKKDNDNYIAIILDAEDKRKWKIGEVKAYLEKSSAENLFSIRWLMGDKTPRETIGRLESQAVLKILLPIGAYGSTEESIFLKLYPNNKSEETPKSNTITISGSGFFIASNGLIATNSHVINKAKKIFVKVPSEIGSATYNAKVLLNDAKNDVAIIQIDDINFKETKPLPYKISEQADIGEKTFTIGYPLNDIMGANYKVADGIISAKSGIGDDVRYYQITIPIQPGNSGGPLFNSQGDIIGITSAKLNGKAIGIQIENVNYAIKSAYLLNLINMLPNIENTPNNKQVPLKELKEQVKILKDFVCLIQVTE
jgi:S1-C subfamily serine protease